jgi:hypothetical protein
VIYLSIRQYLSYSWKKWLASIFIIFILAVGLKYLVIVDFLPKYKTLIFKDYIFSSLSYPLYCICAVPLLYSYLVYDIVTRDYEGGYVSFIVSRIENRATYFISKFILIVLTANIFFFINSGILTITAMLFRLPFHGISYYPTLKFSTELGLNTGSIFLIQYSIYVIGLIAIGMIVLTISLLFNSGIYSIIAIVMLMIQGREAFFNDESILKWSPVSQLALSKHYPFYFYNYGSYSNKNIESYTIHYSIIFYLIIIIIAFIVGFMRINRMNLSKKSGG